MEESLKMKALNHPNILNLIGVSIDAGESPYIVMPYMANGSLLSYLRKERPNLTIAEGVCADLVSFITVSSDSSYLYIIVFISPGNFVILSNIIYLDTTDYSSSETASLNVPSDS